MSTNNLSPKVRKSAKKILNLATKSRRSMQVNEMNFVRTSAFIGKEAKRISQPKIDKKKLKKLLNTDFASIASNAGGGGGFNLLDLLGGGLGGGGGRRGGRPGRKPPSRRAQQRYRRRFGNRAANRRFGRLPQFGRGRGIRIPRAGGVLGVAMAGLEYGGRVSEGQTQTQAIAGTAASTAGGIAGAMGGAKGGAAIGALIGSVVPGAGTALGAAIGGLIGGIAGGMAGSSLAGGAADKLTGADKVIGKDEESEKAEKELQKKSKINPLELTLDKFDQVVDRFSKVIVNLDLSGDRQQSDLDAALEKYGPEKVIALLQAQQVAAEIAAEKERKLREQQEAEARVREGFMGDALADVMFPKEEEQDATSKLLESIGVPESAQPAAAMVVESVIEAALMSRGKGLKRPVRTRPLTKPYSLQGPELPPVQGPQQPRTPLVNPEVVTTSPRRKITKKVQSPIEGPAENIFQSQTPAQVRQAELKRQQVKSGSTPEAIRAQRDAESAMQGSAVESTALRQVRQASKTQSIQDQQNLDFARQLMGGKPNERPMGKTVVDYADGPVEFNIPKDAMPRVTPEEYIFRRIQKEYPGMDPNKLIEGKVDFSGLKSDASGINYYTSYNAPNNTTIIMQNGGQMPPQSPPPQMVASSPPPKMSPGPSTYDLASTLGTAILINRLQEC